MDSTRALRKLIVMAVTFFASVISVGALTKRGDATNGPATRPAGVSTYSHEQLQRTANTTDQMSAPNANTGFPAHANDKQLRLSQVPAYVRALEQHQADLDRMLAQATP